MAFSNRARLRRRMDAIPKGMKDALRGVQKANAVELTADQRRYAGHEDGDLRASIRHADESTAYRIKQVVRAGGPLTTKPVRKSKKGNAPLYDYALGQEFGTEDMEANPFFYPPWRAKRKKFRRKENKAVKDAAIAATKIS